MHKLRRNIIILTITLVFNINYSFSQHLTTTKDLTGNYININNNKLDSCKIEMFNGNMFLFDNCNYYKYNNNSKLEMVIMNDIYTSPLILSWDYYNDSLHIIRQKSNNSELEYNYQFKGNSISDIVCNKLDGSTGLVKNYLESYHYQFNKENELQQSLYNLNSNNKDYFWTYIFHYNKHSDIDSICIYSVDEQQQVIQKTGIIEREKSGNYVYKFFEVTHKSNENNYKVIHELHFSDLRTFQCAMAYFYEEYHHPWAFGPCEPLVNMEDIYYWRYIMNIPADNINKKRYFVQLNWNDNSQMWDSIFIQKFIYNENGQINSITERQYDEQNLTIKKNIERNFYFYSDSVIEIRSYKSSNDKLKKKYFFSKAILNSLETTKDDNIIVCPNPTNGNMQIKTPTSVPVFLKIFNISGSVVYSAQITSNQLFNINQLSSGTYIYQLETLQCTYRGKLIKK